MPSRRAHHKSRLGCIQCKRRRVKCDEQRPRCSNCTNRRIECAYANPGPLVWSKQQFSGGDSGASRVAGREGLHDVGQTASALSYLHELITGSNSKGSALPVPVLNLRDLELMAQWCTSTCFTLARDEQTRHIWQVAVPREAGLHPFLMHGLLALSALHMARSTPGELAETYLTVAVAHQNQALVLFRPLLDQINADNAKAVFALSSIAAVFAYGFPQPSTVVATSRDTLLPVDGFVRVMQLARETQDVLNAAVDWIRNGEFGYLLHLGDYTRGLPPDAAQAIEQLRQRNAAYGKVDERHETEVYVHTIDQVEIMLERLHGGCARPSLAFLWSIKVPRKYVALLKNFQPMALVILAHFCVVLHLLRGHWWLQGWGSIMLNSIWKNLDPGWREGIHWPMAVTGAWHGDLKGEVDVP
ncbi:hypothetical protein VTO42DRAFT_2012 [Malbranchea cinnamomea]